MTGEATLALEVASVEALPPVDDDAWGRWLSPSELAYGRGLQRVDEHFGARRAAKRVVARILEWPAEPPWADMRIVREPGAPPRVVLAGEIDAWRAGRGLPVPGVSLTHAGGYVAALAWLPEGS